MKFNDALKLLRSELGLTLEELAEKIDSTKQALSRYERGESAPDVDVVQEWEKKLQLPFGTLTCSDRIPQGFLDSYPDSLIDAYSAWQAAEWANIVDGWNPAFGDTGDLLQLWRKADADFQQAVLALLRAHVR
jgi:transcriptional regulator with XRE-family HTH domain